MSSALRRASVSGGGGNSAQPKAAKSSLTVDAAGGNGGNGGSRTLPREVFNSPVSHLNLRFRVAICRNCLSGRFRVG